MNLRQVTVAACLGAVIVGGALAILGSHNAGAQTPKSIKIVVPFSPGNGPDLVARVFAQQIGDINGSTIVIENRAGGGTVMGTDQVARSTPDGSTLLLAAPAFVVNDALKRAKSTPVSEFVPVCLLAITPMILVVRSDSPYQTFDDLIKAARAKPDELQMVSGGPATSLHMAIEVIKHAANVKMTYVPYGGTAPAIGALMGGHVTAVMSDYPTIVSQLEAKSIRPLVSVSEKRLASLPDVPTLNETGLVKYDADIFYGIVAPAKTPPAVVADMIKMFTVAAQTQEVKKRFETLGLFPSDKCGAQWGDYINKQVEGYAKVARDANIKAE
jgi:tripartite-type tricarboxylate transporter receptor subunit TctC